MNDRTRGAAALGMDVKEGFIDEHGIVHSRSVTFGPEQIVCAECGGMSEVVYPPGSSRIQHVDIAWPDGRHVALCLHPECEQAAIERLERVNK